MKLLFGPTGISNTNIHNALADLLGKPVGAASALLYPPRYTTLPNG